MAKFTFKELSQHRPNKLLLSERFSREKRIRRKPRNPIESDILHKRIVERVAEEEKKGRLTFANGRIHIKLK